MDADAGGASVVGDQNTAKSTAIINLEPHRLTILGVATLSPSKSLHHRRCGRNGSLDILVRTSVTTWRALPVYSLHTFTKRNLCRNTSVWPSRMRRRRGNRTTQLRLVQKRPMPGPRPPLYYLSPPCRPENHSPRHLRSRSRKLTHAYSASYRRSRSHLQS